MERRLHRQRHHVDPGHHHLARDRVVHLQDIRDHLLLALLDVGLLFVHVHEQAQAVFTHEDRLVIAIRVLAAGAQPGIVEQRRHRPQDHVSRRIKGAIRSATGSIRASTRPRATVCTPANASQANSVTNTSQKTSGGARQHVRHRNASHNQACALDQHGSQPKLGRVGQQLIDHRCAPVALLRTRGGFHCGWQPSWRSRQQRSSQPPPLRPKSEPR